MAGNKRPVRAHPLLHNFNNGDDGGWRSDVFSEIEEKINAVTSETGEIETVKLIAPHFISQGFLHEASRRGFIVIQSFEWQKPLLGCHGVYPIPISGRRV